MKAVNSLSVWEIFNLPQAGVRVQLVFTTTATQVTSAEMLLLGATPLVGTRDDLRHQTSCRRRPWTRLPARPDPTASLHTVNSTFKALQQHRLSRTQREWDWMKNIIRSCRFLECLCHFCHRTADKLRQEEPGWALGTARVAQLVELHTKFCFVQPC